MTKIQVVVSVGMTLCRPTDRQ